MSLAKGDESFCAGAECSRFQSTSFLVNNKYEEEKKLFVESLLKCYFFGSCVKLEQWFKEKTDKHFKRTLPTCVGAPLKGALLFLIVVIETLKHRP